MNDNKEKILIIDDEKQIRKLLRVTLSAHNFIVDESENGEDGIIKAAFFKPDLILLDLGMPDIDGIDVLKRIREFAGIPIIVLSVRESENEKIAALDLGADDYITKPFGIGELLARIRTAIRHSKNEINEPAVVLDDLIIDFINRRAKVGKTEIKLSPTEYDIIEILAKNKEKIVTQKYLLEKVWGPSHLNESHYLRIYISQIRKKIEKDPTRPKHLLTESCVGYRLL